MHLGMIAAAANPSPTIASNERRRVGQTSEYVRFWLLTRTAVYCGYVYGDRAQLRA
jgi:hypothetical protein